MFFIGMMGIDNKEKEIKFLNNIPCKNCEKSLGGKLIKTYKFFHLFFIPLIKWGERYFIICNGCNSIYEISKDRGKNIENGDEVEITYWDLKSVEFERNNYWSQNRCPRCGEVVQVGFKYCPHCGEKIR